VQQLNQVTGRLRKLHFKNLGVLLRLQEELDPELFDDAEKVEPVGTEKVEPDEVPAEKSDGEAGAGQEGV
jgi:hypothetical protein